jgi:hypothetical protein
MKEKIIEILKSSLRAFAYIDPVTGESRSAQESAIPEDQFPKIAAELEPLINQEVERRIGERITEDKFKIAIVANLPWLIKSARGKTQYPYVSGHAHTEIEKHLSDDLWMWLRSRILAAIDAKKK